jgi:hypothetical protein
MGGGMRVDAGNRRRRRRSAEPSVAMVAVGSSVRGAMNDDGVIVDGGGFRSLYDRLTAA